MRVLVLLFALLMPAVAWMSNAGLFGPDNATISNQHPTLPVTAGYAFAVWGLTFVGDIGFALWQLRARGEHEQALLARVRAAAAAGFALSAAWMPVFSMQIFWLALLIIWASFACLAFAAVVLSRDQGRRRSSAGGPGRRCRCMPAGCRWRPS